MSEEREGVTEEREGVKKGSKGRKGGREGVTEGEEGKKRRSQEKEQGILKILDICTKYCHIYRKPDRLPIHQPGHA